jgi:DNA-binding CsgD family transcriptional regulator/PAS domain-containing protein
MSRTSSDALDTARSRIYEAALEPAAWDRALEALAALTGAHAGAVLVADWNASAALVHAHWNLDDQLWEAWLGGAIADDPWSAALSALPGGFVTTGCAAVDRRRLRRSSFYNELLAPRRIEDVLATSLAKANGVHSIVSVHRHEQFERRDVEALARLVPDLRLVVRLQREMGELRMRAEQAEGALDAVPVAVLVLDAQGRVVHANREAEALLRRPDGLVTVGGRLCCARPEETARLHGAVARVAQGSAGRAPCTAVATAASRRSGRRPLGVLVAPLPRPAAARSVAALELASSASVVVTVTDPEDVVQLPVETLRLQFGLTRAEARLAAALAARQSLEEFAVRTGVSMNTARTTLKGVFAKTGCRRQSELVLVLASGVARDAAAPGRQAI